MVSSKGTTKKSEAFFRKAIATLTGRNPNPCDGEPYYHLGLALQLQGKTEEAYDQYYKACWNSAWQASAYFALAQLDAAKSDWRRALQHLGNALDRNGRNSRAWTLKAVVLRKAGQSAREVCIRGLELDEFNLPLYFELFLAEGGTLDTLRTLARNSVQNYITYALDYAAAGLYSDAIKFLSLYTGDEHPMVDYYMAWWHHLSGNDDVSMEWLWKAAAVTPDGCFPNRLEDIAVLRYATDVNKEDAMAPYYLGNLWYDRRQYEEAIQQWELSAARNANFATVARNLGIAYFNKKKEAGKALRLYTKAFSLDETDAGVLMELDQLHRRLNADVRQRLEFLERHLPVVEERDDLYLERAALHNFLGGHDTAYQLIMDRKFHPWEGGEGKVSGQYVYSLVELAKQNLHAGRYQEALALLEQARVYPHNLGEGKLFGARENDIFYWQGIACERLGDKGKATAFFGRAAEGNATPAAALFYNDQQPDKIFYQGLAWKKLGDPALAERIFDGLLEYGVTHLEEEVRTDYFAVSLPDLLIFEDDGQARHQAHCYYMMGLSHLGSGRKSEAAGCLKKVLGLDAMHFGARTHLALTGHKKEQSLTI
ncbi:tetratricopeptide repeat protein [Puia sp. P3]|uniref:tetratricopeptide repeat protein n=1 Tax=Puia sp. P3 TaxID=3423952 RepID=UPI003D664714